MSSPTVRRTDRISATVWSTKTPTRRGGVGTASRTARTIRRAASGVTARGEDGAKMKPR